MDKFIRFLPVFAFLGLALFLGYSVLNSDKAQGSAAPIQGQDPMIGKLVPQLRLRVLERADARIPSGQSDDKGELSVVNFWASWCTPCLVEHPALMLLADEGVEIIGIAFDDKAEALNAYLDRHGNPFSTIYLDTKGEAMLQYGAKGVPETFVISEQNKIKTAIRGFMDPEIFKTIVLPALNMR